MENYYAGRIHTSTLQTTNNKEIIVKGIRGIIFFSKDVGEDQSRGCHKEPRLKKVNMAFCLQITEKKSIDLQNQARVLQMLF